MTIQKNRFRLITRSDFDGLACAVLLKKLELINEIMFVHPKDMQEGRILVGPTDITTNLPYVPGAHLVFDHHHSETIRAGGETRENHIIDAAAPSAARVVYNYYGGKTTFPKVPDDFMNAVDKGDSADFSRQEILRPAGWNLLNFLMDARTGLGRFRHFRVSNYQLMMDLIEYCHRHSIEEILALPDVKERADLFLSHGEKFEEQVRSCASHHGPLTILDLREEEIIYTGNRFMVYALFPDCQISIHLMWGRLRQNTVFATGKSIFYRDNPLNIGELMLANGGGGHSGAGTCQVDNDKVEETRTHLIQQIQEGCQ